MRVVKVRNVTEAWARLPETLRDAEAQDSRAGRVLVCPEPVATVYSHPAERVLLDARRDANPFFHLVEALWMLAGRDDAATLNHYVRNFGERFGEPDGRIHGAYGHRWRNALGVDQLDVIVSKLRDNPADRQAVLQMWNAEEDNCDDLEGKWRDRPCNTHVYFRVRNTTYRDPPVTDQNSAMHEERITAGRDKVLDMTVCCRSNDMVFGGYGANAVHFSVLQEYMAARIGVAMGTYTQISNNFHVYADVWAEKAPVSGRFDIASSPLAMFSWPGCIDMDLVSFFGWHEQVFHATEPALGVPIHHNLWFVDVAQPVVRSWYYHKHKNRAGALGEAQSVKDLDWRRACVEWLERRYGK